LKDHEVEIGPKRPGCRVEREGVALSGSPKSTPLIPVDQFVTEADHRELKEFRVL